MAISGKKRMILHVCEHQRAGVVAWMEGVVYRSVVLCCDVLRPNVGKSYCATKASVLQMAKEDDVQGLEKLVAL